MTDFVITTGTGNFATSGTESVLKQSYIETTTSVVVPLFVLTGTDAALRQYKVNISSGAFAVSGTSASTLVNRHLLSISASFTLTGTNNDIDEDHILTSTPAAFALTGTPANISNYKLATSSTLFALTGTNNDIDADHILISTPASFVLTGTNNDIDEDHILRPNSVNFAVVGTNVIIARSRVIIISPTGRVALCDTGAFTLDGTPAKINELSLIRTQTGSCVYVGTSAALTKGLPLTAASVEYSLVADPLRLIKKAELITVPASIQVHGIPCNLNNQLELNTEPTNFVISFADNTVVKGNRCTTETRLYTVSGSNSTLTKDTPFSAETGLFVFQASEINSVKKYPPVIRLTGTTIALQCTRQVRSVTSSYTLVGSSNEIIASYTCSTSTSYYELIGQPNVSSAIRILLAAPADFSLTENTAALTHSRMLLDEPNSIILLGSGVLFNQNYSVQASNNSYMFVGTASGLTRDLNCEVQSSSMTVVGTSVKALYQHKIVGANGYLVANYTSNVLLRPRTLTTTPGEVRATGQRAGLRESAVKTITESISFALTGTVAVLGEDSDLVSVTSNIALVGTAVNLVKPRTLTTTPGEVRATGQRAGLRESAVKTITDPTSFSLVGTVAVLGEDSDLVSVTSNIALVGTAVNLIKPRTLTTGTVALRLTGQRAIVTKNNITLTASPASYSVVGVGDFDVKHGIRGNSVAVLMTPSDSLLQTTRRLIGDTSGVLLSSEVVSINKYSIVQPTSADVHLTPNDAVLDRTVVVTIVAESGNLTCNGNAVATTQTSILISVPATVITSSTDVLLHKGYASLTTIPHHYTLTGSTVQNKKTRVIAGASGAFSVIVPLLGNQTVLAKWVPKENKFQTVLDKLPTNDYRIVKLSAINTITLK